MLISKIITLTLIEETLLKSIVDFDDVSCYLFGSYAKGKPTTASDIDILLLFDKNRYSYDLVRKVQTQIHEGFKQISKFCQPIYGYTKDIDKDEYILFRQYVNYGVHLYGLDIKSIMKRESEEKLKELEFSNYWTPMYLKKIKLLDQLVENDLNIDDVVVTIEWQYLFLITYWYAKAQLTLIDRQYSLNNFTLLYIYTDTELMNVRLTSKQKETLDHIQKQRDHYENFEDMQNQSVSFAQSFVVIKEMMGLR